jgi:aldose 1-epimerase
VAVLNRPDTYSVRPGEAEGYETWTLVSAEAGVEATFAPKAGMVGCSLRHHGDELLHLGAGVAAYVRTGSTMGIPFLHPWANRLAGFEYTFAGRTVSLDRDSPLIKLDPNGLPIHGLLAGSPYWEVGDVGADQTRAMLSAELDFGSHGDLLEYFPFPHVVRIDVRLAAAELNIDTTVTATADVEVPISFGFHPYLRLPNVPREHWEVELPVRERLLLDERMIPTGAREPVSYPRSPLGDRSFDDAFAGLFPERPFLLAGGGRAITTRFIENYPVAQVYTPPGAGFICFEPMTAPTNALRDHRSLPVVPPGQAFSASFSIGVAERN